MDTPELLHEHTRRCWWDADGAIWNCPTAGAMESADERDRPLVDVRDMVVVHTALLREFRLAPAVVARASLAAGRSVEVADRHLGLLCDLLHHHHAGEDALLWPLLRARLPETAALLVDTVEAQHAALDESLHRVTAARSSWRDRRDAASRDTLVDELRTLHSLLSEHLDAEERTVLPVAATVLTEAEWHAIGEAAVAAMPKSTLPLTFGMFAYEGDPEVLRDMLRTAPPLPRLLLPRIAPRVYARRATQIHGTARP
jgi:iron-sulfur cluster repair protein YtfE (RIC family)